MTENKHQNVAIVTGAANGIGYAVADVFSAAGYAVGLVDLSENDTRRAASSIEERTGKDTCWCTADVRDLNESTRAYQEICAKLGQPGVLVNNAGIVVRQKARLEDLPVQDFEEMMAIHVNGTLNWSRLALPGKTALYLQKCKPFPCFHQLAPRCSAKTALSA